ncbi:hypothetical protein BE15_25390 [Sorangium cellulosum]|uniref:PEGA domain-containing protein n=1 Tax=Sorangium cellulosum TaxID=56 RepID=A0A150QGM0_SORCE|nr:hypothetical protein BE15_25390 [Sorangium cellulosum]
MGAVAAAPAARAQGASPVVQAAGTSAQATGASPQEGTAGAQASAEVAQRSRDADAAFARGKELYRLGKLDAAHEEYRKAWSLKQSYDIAANLANTELQRGMKVEAAEHLAFCLRSFPATGNPTQHEQVRAQFRAVRKEVGSIVVKANVDGAEVSFNGTAVGRTPFPHEVFVKPGTVAVEARLAGHEPARVTLEVPAGETYTADLALLPQERPAPPAPPSLPPRAEAPAPSPSDGADTGGPRPEVLIAGGAVAGVGVVAGVILTVLAVGRDGDADAQREALVREGGATACAVDSPRCVALRDTLEGAADLKNAVLWTFVGAGAVGLATGAYALWGGGAPRPAVAAAPVVTAHGGALVIRGAW